MRSEQGGFTVKRLVIIGVACAALLVAGVAIAVAAGGSNSSTRGHATVSVKRIAGAGSVLVDAKGRALYRNEQERGSKIICTATCVSFWKPLIVSGTPRSSSSLPGKLAVILRPDGRRQVTYNARPLYTFVLDKAGKVTGDGFKDAFGGHKFTWHVEHPNGSTSSSAATTTTQTPTYTYPGY